VSVGRVAAIVLLATLAAGGARAAEPTYFPLLGRAYDAVLDARFDDVEPALVEACGPAPPEACDLVRAAAVWWRIQLDPFDRSRDPEFERRVDAVIAATGRWAGREPRRAEPLFFLGAAYGVRVQWRVLRGERLSAARDGKRIKESLERALALDPSLQDAYFGIGMYRYYADLVPTILKFFRWLLFLPGGDRERGLAEMQQAREQGTLLRGETDFQLHLVYIWYENRIDEALGLLDDLRRRYPRNPLFLQATAEIHEVYRHDRPTSLDTWRALLALSRRGRVSLPEASEARARVGIAESLDALFETDYAIEQLRVVTEAKPAAPYGVAARAWLQLGAAQDRLGARAEAVTAYRAAIAAAPRDDPERVKARATEALRRRPDPRVTEAYRLSLEGWRRLQRGEVAQAAEALARAQEAGPADPVLRYRIGRLRLAQGRPDEALAEFERVVAQRPSAPPTVLAASFLDAARLIEPRGDRPRAIDFYRRAAAQHGAYADTRRAAAGSLARMQNGKAARVQ
jgi:tetratricopeptide (TPR) repeat protein